MRVAGIIHDCLVVNIVSDFTAPSLSNVNIFLFCIAPISTFELLMDLQWFLLLLKSTECMKNSFNLACFDYQLKISHCYCKTN